MKRHHSARHNIKMSPQSFLYKASSPLPPEHSEKKSPAIGIQQLSGRFPEIKVGKQCIDEALKFLEAYIMFAVMLIQLDDFDALLAAEGEELLVDRMMRTANVIRSECTENQGRWGLIEQDLFGCFFPELESLACESIAESIRAKLETGSENALTIGISEYPLAHFNRIATLENARKALDHAAMKATEKTAVFDAVSLNISGDRYYQEGNIERAVEEFKAALVLDPSNANVRNSLGVCYSALNAFDSALKEFEVVSRMRPDTVMPVYNAGLAYMLAEDEDNALTCFEKAVNMEENHFESVFQAGKLYLNKGDLVKAEGYLKKAVHLRSEAGSAHRLLGECYEALSQNKEAYAAYRRAVRCNPNDAAAVSALGTIMDKIGENPEIALLFCRHSVEIAPDNGLFHQRLGRLYQKNGKDTDALHSFERAEQLGWPCTEEIDTISQNFQKDKK